MLVRVTHTHTPHTRPTPPHRPTTASLHCTAHLVAEARPHGDRDRVDGAVLHVGARRRDEVVVAPEPVLALLLLPLGLPVDELEPLCLVLVVVVVVVVVFKGAGSVWGVGEVWEDGATAAMSSSSSTSRSSSGSSTIINSGNSSGRPTAGRPSYGSLVLDRALEVRLLALLLRQAPLLGGEPLRVVALKGDALAAVELEDPAGDVVEEEAALRVCFEIVLLLAVLLLVVVFVFRELVAGLAGLGESFGVGAQFRVFLVGQTRAASTQVSPCWPTSPSTPAPFHSPVVRDRDDGALELRQEGLEPRDRLGVEVVGRLLCCCC